MWMALVDRVRARPRNVALAALVLAVSYVVLGRVSFAVSVEHNNVTSVVFAPEGLALALAILFGRRVIWGVFVGQTVLSIWSGPSLLGGAAIGIVNSVECAIGAALFVRWKISPRLDRPRDVALFVALVFLILQPISATGGVSVLWALGAIPTDWVPAGWESFWIHGVQQPLPDSGQIVTAWLHWWIGNSVGQILVAPLLLAWAVRDPDRRAGDRRDLLVSVAIVGLAAVLAFAVPVHPLLVLGVTYPLLIWIGLRRGLRGVTTANLLVTPAVIWAGASSSEVLSSLTVAGRLATVGFFVATAWCIFSLMLFALFEERRQLVARLELLARQDPLVPLANRRHFVERLEDHIAAMDGRGTSLAAVLFDIDHFKRINDEQGHAAGDRVLIAVAQTCSSLMRPTDLAARIGGEEFAVVLPDTTLVDAEQFASRLRVAIAGQHLSSGPARLAPVTVSVGIAAWRAGDSLDDVLNRADDAMYEAKRTGRNAVVVQQDSKFHGDPSVTLRIPFGRSDTTRGFDGVDEPFGPESLEADAGAED